MRVLSIGPKEKEAIQHLITYAEKHRIDHELLMKSMRREWAVGDDPSYICYIEEGYRIVYSIEHQPNYGWCRHLSVSVDDIKKMPHPTAVELLMGEFGFRGELNNCLHVWIEKNIQLPTGIIVNAVNVLQEYNDGQNGASCPKGL